ncbi:type IV pilin [Natronomonas gomsonensis]|uniref:type IV pilin n=1 Tax=Natronomonas gomsonensis TaxID=1046043 RepID=UPI0015BC2F6B|nr:type IV pilin N-terminal domain-containing protein [Natronomonas gomsonensis]
MQFTGLFKSDEERAVSPVIGVILMVAITVILAAVIGTFVLGLGDQVQQTSPNAQWETDYNSSSSWAISHTSGDDVDETTLKVSLSGASNLDNGDYDWSTLGTGSDTTVSAGDSAEFNNTAGSYNSGSWTDGELDSATIRLVWTAEGGGSSSTLTTWEGPNA